MGRGDNRLTRKMRRKRGQNRKKAAAKRAREGAKNKK